MCLQYIVYGLFKRKNIEYMPEKSTSFSDCVLHNFSLRCYVAFSSLDFRGHETSSEKIVPCISFFYQTDIVDKMEIENKECKCLNYNAYIRCAFLE